jgi:hypothetical protein
MVGGGMEVGQWNGELGTLPLNDEKSAFDCTEGGNGVGG